MGEIRTAWRSQIMSATGLLIGIALGVGAMLAVQMGTDREVPRSLSDPLASGIHAATLEQLQTALAAEVQSRRELADRIAELDAELSSLRRSLDEANESSIARSEFATKNSLLEGDPIGQTQTDLRTEEEVARFDDEVLLSQGVDPSDVERLHERWARYELERQTIADSALREGWFFSGRHRNELARSDRELREDLPDLDYDRYLYALGKPNRVVAGEVLPGSTASDAGLQRGDVILSYGDTRMFNPGDVFKASSQGDVGKSTRLVYLRNGEKRTVDVELGPLGVILEPSRGSPLAD